MPGGIPKSFLEKEENRAQKVSRSSRWRSHAVLAGALVYSGCGGDDDRTSNSSANTGQAAQVRHQARHDGEAVDHAERSSAAGGHGGVARAVHGEDRHQGRRRGRGLGRPARPHPQRGGLRRRPGHHPGRHHAGAVLRRARRLRGSLGAASRTSAARAPTRRASGRPPRSSARTAPGRSRGSPRRGRSTTARTSSRRPASIRRPPSRTGTVPRHAAGDQGQGPGHPAVRHARQEGVRPRPSRDAVRVGRRRRGAVRGQHAVDDQLARGVEGVELLRRPGRRTGSPTRPARA